MSKMSNSAFNEYDIDSDSDDSQEVPNTASNEYDIDSDSDDSDDSQEDDSDDSHEEYSDDSQEDDSDDSQEDDNTLKLDGSDCIVGFFAGNFNAEHFLKRLINAKIKLHVWYENKKWAKKLKYLQYYAREKEVFYRVYGTPQLVITNSKATFSILSSPEQAKKVVNELVIADKNDGLLKGKAYIEMTSIVDSELSKDICSLIRGREGLYLEAMVQGSKATHFQFLLAGTKSVVEFCTPYFLVIGEPHYLGDVVGLASDFHMGFQMLRANILVSISEGVTLATQTGFSLTQMRCLFNMTQISCDYIDSKMETIINQSYEDVNESMQQLQQDLSHSIRVCDKLKQPTPLTANAHEIVKHCCKWGYGELDTAKIYEKIRY